MRNAKYEEDHAYVSVKVEKCSSDNRKPGDPDCADDIDDWLLGKRLAIRVINNKVNLAHASYKDLL